MPRRMARLMSRRTRARALRLLQQADQKFAAADKALKAGDLEGYAKAVDEAARGQEQRLPLGEVLEDAVVDDDD